MAFNFGFFGSSEHRVFDYKPRYYDQEKEALKEKFGHVDGSGEKEPYTPGSYVKGSFRDGHYQRSRQMTGKAQRIIGLVGLLLFFLAMIFFTKLYGMFWE